MPIPDYEACMQPLLEFAADGAEHRIAEAVAVLSDRFGLSDAERAELLPSGTQFVMANRVGWARTYLKKAGLLTDPRRGFFMITERGRALLAENPTNIGAADLVRYQEFRAFIGKNGPMGSSEGLGAPGTAYATPEEALEFGYQTLTEALAGELREKILACSPAFFERLVVELLVRMGYGGSLAEASSVVGKSGDAGIDGIIKEDKLGLEAIYVQAKRWEGSVGRPELQKFVGALLGQKSRKGVFITSSSFTKEAQDYADGVDAKIVLIDGERLTRLMIEHDLGVGAVRIFAIKRLDSDYFEEG